MLTSNLLLISVVILALIVCVTLGTILRYASTNAKKIPGGEERAGKLRVALLRNSFQQAVALIEANIAARSERYRVPWILVMNEGDAIRIPRLGLAEASGITGGEAPSRVQGISWHVFGRGVVLDIEAAYLESAGPAGQERDWDEILRLCGRYRPRLPFDSMVVAVPAAMLLAQDVESRLGLERRAELARRRLDAAQRRYAMRFAIYVIVTECEAIAGFREFSEALPEHLQASMLGWSSPYDLSANYQPDWIVTATRSIAASVSDASAELYAVDADGLDAGSVLLLPMHVQALEEPLRRYVDGLLHPGAIGEPLFFRGLYLIGDGAVPAQLLQGTGEATPGAEQPAAAGGVPHAQPRLPVFLRDLLERKIFLERGLTRPVRDRHLTRPGRHSAVRWGGVAFLAVWGAGLAVATVQLGRHNASVLSALNKLDTPVRDDDMAERTFEWYRRQAADALAMDDGLRADSAWTVFMPGAWNVFDDLNARVQARYTSELGRRVAAAVERGLSMHAAQLTAGHLDTGTGLLTVDDQCGTFGPDPDGGKPDGVGMDGRIELRALQRLVEETGRFDAALQAFQDLRSSGSGGGGEALRRVARYALGVQPNGDLANILRYFHQEAGPGAAELLPAKLEHRFRCTFGKASRALNRKLFVDNPLLLSERAIRQAQSELTSEAVNPDDTAQMIADWRQLISMIESQQDLLATGTGAWMHQPALVLGAGYDRVMALASRNRLLGPDLAVEIRARDQADFLAFKVELARLLAGADSGVAWQDNESRYAQTAPRQALRDALISLIGQPFMAPARGLALPAPDDGEVIVWDRAQLDQALRLGDQRKRYLSEGLRGFPAALQPAVERAVSGQFGRLILDQVAGAATLTRARPTDDAVAFTAANSQLGRIKSLLAELGASRQADALGAVMSQDAMQHLRLVDQSLQSADLFAIRDDVADARRVPTLALFGVADGAALGSYLERQSSQALAFGAEAAAYLAALDPMGVASLLAQRWRMLNQDMERYRLRNPNSSLLRLEQFVQAAAAPASENCKAQLVASDGGDYFAGIQARLYSVLQGRCQQRYIAELRQQWENFAATFNILVGGRVPFAGVHVGAADRYASVGPFDGGGGMPAPADFGQLGLALKRYQEVSAVQRASVDEQHGAMPENAVTRFISQFEQVRTLLSPLYPSQEGERSGYDVSVVFRANRAEEVAANQLIDWTLTIGDRSISRGDPPQPLYWDYGMPVTLTLRLAKDSSLVAAGDPDQSVLTTDGRSLTWQFTDPWALISMMQRQWEVDTQRGGASQLLRFEFPLVMAHAPQSAQAQAPVPERGRVYLRLTLMPVGKKVPLPWPGSFPVRAPDWSAQ